MAFHDALAGLQERDNDSGSGRSRTTTRKKLTKVSLALDLLIPQETPTIPETIHGSKRLQSPYYLAKSARTSNGDPMSDNQPPSFYNAPPPAGPPAGTPLSEEQPPPKQKMSRGKKIGLWAGGALVAFAVIGATGNKTPDTNPPPAAAPSVTALATPTSAPTATTAETVDPAVQAAADKQAADKVIADKAAADKAAKEKDAADKAAADQAAKDKAAADKAAAEQAAIDAMTTSQGQSVSKAEEYLDYQAFSRKGLIEQLEFEGFSKADATFAVDHITVDWKDQADKKAANYLENQSFSGKGLREQLEFEGFTGSQAAHGVKSVGL